MEFLIDGAHCGQNCGRKLSQWAQRAASRPDSADCIIWLLQGHYLVFTVHGLSPCQCLVSATVTLFAEYFDDWRLSDYNQLRSCILAYEKCM